MNQSDRGPSRAEAAAIFAPIEAALIGPPKPAALRLQRAPRMDNCEQHGEFPIEVYLDGRLYAMNPGGCPDCIKARASKRLLAGCNIPPRFEDCTFENFAVESPDHAHVLARCREYAENFGAYHRRGASFILCGRPGTGKNHLATAIIKRLLADGFTVLRVKAGQYLDGYWGRSFDQRDEWIAELSRIDLLMLDEVGRSPNAKGAQDALFRLLDARSEEVKPSLITTNLNRAGLIEVLGEAMYDRLKEGGFGRLTLKWESYRGRDADGGGE